MDHPLVTAFINTMYNSTDHQFSHPSVIIVLASGTRVPLFGCWVPEQVMRHFEVGQEDGKTVYRSKPISS
jgi:hypothetical protein